MCTMHPQQVACPDCQSWYCTKCGSAEHGQRPCPVSKDFTAWLGKGAKNTKPCPNCGTGLTKNGGCNHVRLSVYQPTMLATTTNDLTHNFTAAAALPFSGH